MYAWTAADSWKVKHLRRNHRVRVCASTFSGDPLDDWIDAQVRVLETSEEVKKQHKHMVAKYGWQFWLFDLFGKLRRDEYVVLEISAL